MRRTLRRGSESAKKLPRLIADIIGARGMDVAPVEVVVVAEADAELEDERVLESRLGRLVTA